MPNPANDRQTGSETPREPEPTIAPALAATGVAVALVGLLVAPLVITPIGVALAVAAAVAWSRPSRRRTAEPGRAESARESALAGDRVSRESLLRRATIALGGLVALAVTVPVAGFAILPSFIGQRRRAVDLGPVGAFPEGQYTVVRFLADPQAGAVSRRAAYIRNNGFLGSTPSFTILSSRCTHVGCPTQPNGPLLPERRRSLRTDGGEISVVPTQPSGFGCPCHGSQFDTEGNRTAGPAPRALDRYEFSIRNGRLYLGRLYSVDTVVGTGARARIRSFALKGAGEPASGPEAWLYPIDPPS